MRVKNINKNQLSKVINVGSSVIGKWVSGAVTDLRLPSLISLSIYFNVTIDELVFSNISANEQLLKVFKTNSNLPCINKIDSDGVCLNKSIPDLLIYGNKDELFCYIVEESYYHIYPKYSCLIFSKVTQVENKDTLLVKHKILREYLLLLLNNNKYYSVLTKEIVEIEQYDIVGILMNSIFEKAALN